MAASLELSDCDLNTLPGGVSHDASHQASTSRHRSMPAQANSTNLPDGIFTIKTRTHWDSFDDSPAILEMRPVPLPPNTRPGTLAIASSETRAFSNEDFDSDDYDDSAVREFKESGSEDAKSVASSKLSGDAAGKSTLFSRGISILSLMRMKGASKSNGSNTGDSESASRNFDDVTEAAPSLTHEDVGLGNASNLESSENKLETTSTKDSGKDEENSGGSRPTDLHKGSPANSAKKIRNAHVSIEIESDAELEQNVNHAGTSSITASDPKTGESNTGMEGKDGVFISWIRKPLSYFRKNRVEPKAKVDEDDPSGQVEKENGDGTERDRNGNDDDGTGSSSSTSTDRLNAAQDNSTSTAAINIDNVLDAEGPWEPSMLERFLNLLYYLGMNPTYFGATINETYRFSFLQKAYFCTISLIGILHAIEFVKFKILHRFDGNPLIHYIGLASFAIAVLFRCLYTFAVCMKVADLWELITAIRSWKYTKKSRGNKELVIVFLLCLSAFLPAIMRQLTTLVLENDMDVKQFTLDQAGFGANTVLYWGQPGNGSSKGIDIIVEYSNNATTGKILSGSAYLTVSTTGDIHGSMIKVTCLMVALTLYSITRDYEQTLEDQQFDDLEGYQEIYVKYKLLRHISRLTNKVFGIVFKIIHPDYLLFCAYALSDHLIRHESPDRIPEHCVGASILIAFYVTAVKVAGVNAKMLSFSYKHFPGAQTKFYERGEAVATAVLLHQITSDPIGLGTGLSYINGTFMGKFISVVGSFFLFFTDSDRPQNSSTR